MDIGHNTDMDGGRTEQRMVSLVAFYATKNERISKTEKKLRILHSRSESVTRALSSYNFISSL